MCKRHDIDSNLESDAVKAADVFFPSPPALLPRKRGEGGISPHPLPFAHASEEKGEAITLTLATCAFKEKEICELIAGQLFRSTGALFTLNTSAPPP